MKHNKALGSGLGLEDKTRGVPTGTERGDHANVQIPQTGTIFSNEILSSSSSLSDFDNEGISLCYKNVRKKIIFIGTIQIRDKLLVYCNIYGLR